MQTDSLNSQVDVWDVIYVNWSDFLLARLAAKIMKDVKNIDITLPLRRLTWHDAMETYGTDKPDTRFDLKLLIWMKQLKMSILQYSRMF